MQSTLDFDHMSRNFILEGHLPGSQARRLVVEYEIIPLFPKTPGSNDKNIHEERLVEGLLSYVELLVDI
jgi:hypothetical protein